MVPSGHHPQSVLAGTPVDNCQMSLSEINFHKPLVLLMLCFQVLLISGCPEFSPKF